MKRLRVFVDFDGTITRGDVGNMMFRRFGGPVCDALVSSYRAGEISAVECFRKEAAAMGTVHGDVLNAFLDSQVIDPEFPAFVRFCRSHAIPLTVVSDGLDLYIRRILDSNGLEDVAAVANHGRLDALTGGLRLEFPRTNAECSLCACCKRNVMLEATADDEVIVYVGDGHSDRCPVRYADIVFARDALQTFCQQENITYLLYRTFDDVTRRMTELLHSRLHKRTAAEHLRREAFAAE
jgi:2-hydroxy-3-keto-5-methylthiopentenyl-1-phosphate phosphatase